MNKSFEAIDSFIDDVTSGEPLSKDAATKALSKSIEGQSEGPLNKFTRLVISKLEEGKDEAYRVTDWSLVNYNILKHYETESFEFVIPIGEISKVDKVTKARVTEVKATSNSRDPNRVYPWIWFTISLDNNIGDIKVSFEPKQTNYSGLDDTTHMYKDSQDFKQNWRIEDTFVYFSEDDLMQRVVHDADYRMSGIANEYR